jgi:hypothetical protein
MTKPLIMVDSPPMSPDRKRVQGSARLGKAKKYFPALHDGGTHDSKTWSIWSGCVLAITPQPSRRGGSRREGARTQASIDRF